jgi:hypothetical protein
LFSSSVELVLGADNAEVLFLDSEGGGAMDMDVRELVGYA